MRFGDQDHKAELKAVRLAHDIDEALSFIAKVFVSSMEAQRQLTLALLADVLSNEDEKREAASKAADEFKELLERVGSFNRLVTSRIDTRIAKIAELENVDEN